MKKRVFMAVFLAACMTVGVCGCSSADEEDVFTGDTPEVPEWQENLDAISPAVYADISELDLEPGTYISVIGKMENSPYWQQVAAGVQQAADDINEKLGYSGSDAVRVLFNAPADSEDIDEQVNILDEEMARYPDVIAIASIDENASEVQFDLAIANGISIVAFDSGNSYQGIQCTCMTNNTEAAAMGAEKLCEAIGESGEVALIVPDSVSGNAKDRVSAFQQEISENHPGVSIAETIYMDQIDELKRKAAAEKREQWIMREIELLMTRIDSISDKRNVEILSRVYIAYLNRECSWELFEETAQILERFIYSDGEQLKRIYDRHSGLINPEDNKTILTMSKNNYCDRLVALGLVWQKFTNVLNGGVNVDYHLTEAGLLLARAL